MHEKFGLSAAMVVPVNRNGTVDLVRLVAHAGWCLASGCRTVSLFGTTGEGASLAMATRERMLGALAGAGIDPGSSLVGGAAASAVDEAVAQIRQVRGAGCRTVLLPPPHYYKDLTEEGLFAWFAAVIEGLGADAGGLIVYNIPSVTAVPITVSLVDRLRAAFPGVLAGIKDSSGDIASTHAFLSSHGDLAVLVGDERYLAEGMRHGAQGTISGLANILPGQLNAIIETGRERPDIAGLVDEVLRHPVVPAVKALVAHRTGDEGWLRVRPPLHALDPAAARQLGAVADSITDTAVG